MENIRQDLVDKIAKMQKVFDAESTPAATKDIIKNALQSANNKLAEYDAANKEVVKAVEVEKTAHKEVTVAKEKAANQKEKAKTPEAKKTIEAKVVSPAVAKARAAVEKTKNAKAKVIPAKKAVVKATKSLKNLVASKPGLAEMYAGTSESELRRDAARKALKPGKRTSASGNTYYEKRHNRVDLTHKNQPYLKKGGAVGDLEKELHKLQRELNSNRLLTYREGDESEEEMARQRERATKLARFNEVLKLLNEGESNFEKGGQLSYKKLHEQWQQTRNLIGVKMKMYGDGKNLNLNKKLDKEITELNKKLSELTIKKNAAKNGYVSKFKGLSKKEFSDFVNDYAYYHSADLDKVEYRTENNPDKQREYIKLLIELLEKRVVQNNNTPISQKAYEEALIKYKSLAKKYEISFEKGGTTDEITYLDINSKNPLSSQLQKLTGDSWNMIDFEMIDPDIKNLDTGSPFRHKKSGKVFAVNPKTLGMAEGGNVDVQRELLIDENRGIYIPQHFYNTFDFAKFGLKKEDYTDLSSPDNEFYWDAWEELLIEAKTDQGSTLEQEGDLWLVPADYNSDDQFESGGEIKKIEDIQWKAANSPSIYSYAFIKYPTFNLVISTKTENILPGNKLKDEELVFVVSEKDMIDKMQAESMAKTLSELLDKDSDVISKAMKSANHFEDGGNIPSNEIDVRTSNGTITADPVTGKVISVEADEPDNYITQIDRFDLEEYKKYYKTDEIPDSIDILDLGTFMKDGSYEGPEQDWRDEMANGFKKGGTLSGYELKPHKDDDDYFTTHGVYTEKPVITLINESGFTHSNTGTKERWYEIAVNGAEWTGSKVEYNERTKDYYVTLYDKSYKVDNKLKKMYDSLSDLKKDVAAALVGESYSGFGTKNDMSVNIPASKYYKDGGNIPSEKAGGPLKPLTYKDGSPVRFGIVDHDGAFKIIKTDTNLVANPNLIFRYTDNNNKFDSAEDAYNGLKKVLIGLHKDVPEHNPAPAFYKPASFLNKVGAMFFKDGGTLSSLKRKLGLGQGIKLVNYFGQTDPNDPNDKSRGRLGKTRFVVKVQTNGVYFSPNKTDKTGSYWEFPVASLVDVTDNGFTVYAPGERDLNEAEKNIKANAPKDDEQDRLDMMGDGSTMYYRRKSYYEKSGYGYLYNNQWEKGLRYDSNKEKIIDKTIKGPVELAYEFVDDGSFEHGGDVPPVTVIGNGEKDMGPEISDTQIVNIAKRFNSPYNGQVLGFVSTWNKGGGEFEGLPVVYFSYLDEFSPGGSYFSIASGVVKPNGDIHMPTDAWEGIFEHEVDALRTAKKIAEDENYGADFYESGGNVTDHRVQEILNGYITAALWSTIDPDTSEPFDAAYSRSDIAPATLKAMENDVRTFLTENEKLINSTDLPDVNIGHDLWLTRNGHGSGFWDRDIDKDIADQLTAAAKAMKEIDLEVGDDGKIHYFPEPKFETGGEVDSEDDGFKFRIKGKLKDWDQGNKHYNSQGGELGDLIDLDIYPDGSFDTIFKSYSIAFEGELNEKLKDEIDYAMQLFRFDDTQYSLDGPLEITKHYAKGGKVNAGISRDRKFRSQEPHEQRYQRKTTPKNPHYMAQGGSTKKLNWVLGNDKAGKKYYYGFNNGKFYATEESNITTPGLQIKDIGLVFMIDKDHFMDDSTRQEFIKEMKGLFPELDRVDIIQAVHYEKGGKVDNTFNYMMLSRLQSDCDYFLGYGNRSIRHLPRGSVDEQIKEMKRLWNNLPEKPEWLSMEEIEDYEKKMKNPFSVENDDGVWRILKLDRNGDPQYLRDSVTKHWVGVDNSFKNEKEAKEISDKMNRSYEKKQQSGEEIPTFEKGGNVNAGISRDRKFRSQEPHEQRYQRKTSPKNPQYRESGGQIKTKEEFYKAACVYLKKYYYLDPIEMDMTDDSHPKADEAFEAGETPQEFVDAYAERYDLEKFSDGPYGFAKGGKIGKELLGATQNGEPKPSGYFLERFENRKKEAIVRDETGNLERYGKSPNFAGYHLIIDGVDYEFIDSVKESGGKTVSKAVSKARAALNKKKK